MKNRTRYFFYFSTLLLLLYGAESLRAQEYKNGIGVRLGGIGEGLTFKHFLNEHSAIEGIASFGRRSFLLTALYEKQLSVGNTPGLYWFYGGGVHLGVYNNGYGYFYTKGKHGNVYYYEDDHLNYVGVGADFIIGMEYKFQKAPFSLGLDLKPFVDFNSGFFGYWDGALTARFTF